jgi:hypothetical protein
MNDQWFTRYIETLDTRLQSLESKMDSVLRFKWQIMGGTALVSIIIGIAIELLIFKFGNK